MLYIQLVAEMERSFLATVSCRLGRLPVDQKWIRPADFRHASIVSVASRTGKIILAKMSG